MEIIFWIIAIIVCVYLFMRFNAQRGTRFARAVIYLQLLGDGESEDSANRTAMFTFSKHDTSDWGPMVAMAKQYSQMHYGGKQLPVIAAARSKGFMG